MERGSSKVPRILLDGVHLPGTHTSEGPLTRPSVPYEDPGSDHHSTRTTDLHSIPTRHDTGDRSGDPGTKRSWKRKREWSQVRSRDGVRCEDRCGRGSEPRPFWESPGTV